MLRFVKCLIIKPWPCLASQVDAGEHVVLGVVVEHREGQVEALQEDQRGRLHLGREAQRAAQALHTACALE